MKSLLAGFVRLHVLYHAAEGPITGVWIAGELRRHGYRIGPGTLYPLLRSLEKEGYLRSQATRQGRVRCVHYAATAKSPARFEESARETARTVSRTGGGNRPWP